MPELNVMESPKVAGFVDSSHSNANRRRADKEEKEIEELMQSRQEDKEQEQEQEVVVAEEATKEAAVKEDDKDLTREEKTYKKRYDDLRRHQNKLVEQVKTLEAQVNDPASFAAPTTEEELEAWKEKYPDVANIVSTLAKKEAQAMYNAADERLSRLDEIAEQADRAKAEAEIRAIHSDFDELKESDTFHDWVDVQPKWVKDALYVNSDDPASVARVIDLYKADNNIVNKGKKASAKKAAAAIVTKKGRTSVDAEESNGRITESDVNKMSAAEYEKRSDEIMEAIRGGRFVYDMTGAAR
jgi:DNA repair exonuclease SbcCD ATPase subunit